jgi:hypothetical protein
MKNNQQKGFVVPLIIFAISLVLVGGGVNYYLNTKSENSDSVSDKQNLVWDKVDPVEKLVEEDEEEETQTNQDQGIFCSLSNIKKIKINYKETAESYKGIHYIEYETKIYSTPDFLKSYQTFTDEDGDWKIWINHNKNTKNVTMAETWNLNGEKKCNKSNYQQYFGLPISPINYLEEILNKDMTNETKIVNGIECTLTTPTKTPNYGTVQECINRENCIIIQTIALTDINWEGGIILPAGRIMDEVTSINKTDFDESILEIPNSCILSASIPMDNEENFNGSENGLESEINGNINLEENDSISTESEPNDCRENCAQMKETCSAKGMNYTRNEYVPFCEGSNCPYHRSCELSCYSN